MSHFCANILEHVAVLGYSISKLSHYHYFSFLMRERIRIITALLFLSSFSLFSAFEYNASSLESVIQELHEIRCATLQHTSSLNFDFTVDAYEISTLDSAMREMKDTIYKIVILLGDLYFEIIGVIIFSLCIFQIKSGFLFSCRFLNDFFKISIIMLKEDDKGTYKIHICGEVVNLFI